MATVEPFDLIIFGGTGDLAMRKLVPALYQRHRDGDLPDNGRVLALSRTALDRDGFLQQAEAQCREFVPAEEFDVHQWRRFTELLDFRQVDAGSPGDYVTLAEWLAPHPGRTRVFYLATSPALFVDICDNLAARDLVTPASRVVLEKPLGHDLASATAISERIGAIFSESQIYRIDHYLGKETVQNLMALRFGNMLFEPLWRREWISDVQITVAEDGGVAGRGAFYDRTGALRDMVQNHLLQLLCIVAMEPPVSLEADAVRDEKLKVLRALEPLQGTDALRNTVRGQYRAGAVDGQPVPGYREESGIPATSTTETFVAVRAGLASWRWSGVPFHLRTGKRLQQRLAEIVVNFRGVPHNLFEGMGAGPQPNRLVIRLQPDEGVRLYLMAKSRGNRMRLRPVYLDLDFAEAFKARQPDAYERLLMDVLRGSLTLFMRRDELAAAWEWVDPILDAWRETEDEPKPYTAGTWGPAASSALLGRNGSAWREES
ncbi:glucose-6-phosphate dehydrogenase [Arhodomonas aquaeolei]|uniref:glucose-6-phosphate dehydrogenase n=1 Tax=Arhodomonas aquaeolei TaxID=2369 RepID=UPI00037E2AFF|nr:glucose-6-phosphate dehydrogenase [Arhodomonas aquaeolei]MCS4505846.1 glucose-6-phosphate dehydrogenase [Arhodomonas aquaeolei]